MLWGRFAARVQRERFLSLTALRAEGCGIALTGDEYKVSVTGFAFLCHRA